jgi:elongation factor G
VECNQGAPQVKYKEAITTSIHHREVYKKQTGGRGKFADIHVTIEPQTGHDQEGLEFVDRSKAAPFRRNSSHRWRRASRPPCRTVLAGFPIERLKVTLTDGSFHNVDSDALSFEICAKSAFREARAQVQARADGADHEDRGDHARGEHGRYRR